MTGLEYIQRHIDIVKQQIKGSKIKFIITDTDPVTKVKKLQYDLYENKLQTLESIEKSLKALEILKRNVKVSIDYGTERKDISYSLVFYIDNKKTIYVVDEAIKEQNPEHFKELELLKEVLE